MRRTKVKALVFQAREALTRGRLARDHPCADIRQQIATTEQGILPRSMTRAHIERCASCASYERQTRRQRAALALIIPVPLAVGLKSQVLSAALHGGGALAAGAGAGGAAATGAGVTGTGAAAAGAGVTGGGAAAAGGGVAATGLTAGMTTAGAGAIAGGGATVGGVGAGAAATGVAGIATGAAGASVITGSSLAVVSVV